VVRSFFKFCLLKHYIQANIAELVKVKYKDLDHGQKEARVKRCFTDDEYRKVLFTIRAEMDRLEHQLDDAPRKFYNAYRFWYCAVIIVRITALRISDIASLQWESIQGDRLIVHTDKKNVRVDQPITPELKECLNSIVGNTNKWCFPQQNAINGDPATRAQLPVQFGRILKRAEVAQHHFHELRVTRISELDANGHDLKAIAEFAGHTSTKSTEGYIVNR
jgi:integrase